MIVDVGAVAGYLEQSVRDFTDVAVVGISGGVDSSVIASICVAALGKDNVHLISMPYDHVDLGSFNARSAELAEKLGAPHHVVTIGATTIALETAISQVFPDQTLDLLTRANTRPRIRMSVLYGIAGEIGYQFGHRVRVMGTGHLSEDLIGYDTKGGDALCDIFILSDLVKSEVYQLARHYGVPASIIQAVPSAGLYPDQTDQDELGYSYDALEGATLVLYTLLRDGVSIAELSANHPAFVDVDPEIAIFVVGRYKANSHKHEAPATVNLRRAGWFDPA